MVVSPLKVQVTCTLRGGRGNHGVHDQSLVPVHRVEDLRAGLEARSIRETHYTDIKQELEPGARQNATSRSISRRSRTTAESSSSASPTSQSWLRRRRLFVDSMTASTRQPRPACRQHPSRPQRHDEHPARSTRRSPLRAARSRTQIEPATAVISSS
jgi:hypothetical protein